MTMVNSGLKGSNIFCVLWQQLSILCEEKEHYLTITKPLYCNLAYIYVNKFIWTASKKFFQLG